MDFAGPVLQVVLPVYGLIAVGWLAATVFPRRTTA
jgi:predicted permease